MSGNAGAWGGAWLIAPATASAERLERMREAGADVAVLDLEDSVPYNHKDAARAAAIDYLSTYSGAAVLGVRMNAPSTASGMKDTVALAEVGVRPAALVVPKVESARDVELVATVLGADEEQPWVWALIETPAAIQQLPAILDSRVLAGVVFGAADYAAAAGCGRTRTALLYPRSVLACAAAAAGKPAIDSPFFDLEDPDMLRDEAHEARDLGFVGKGAIHPAQVTMIREAFLPSADEVAAAQAVIIAADAAHGAIITVGGQMVGPPLVAAAHAVLVRAGTRAIPTAAGGSS